MQPRYNIAPTQEVDFVHLDRAGNMEMDRGRWWLVPFFVNELPKGVMFNAWIETVDTSGAFRNGFSFGLQAIEAELRGPCRIVHDILQLCCVMTGSGAHRR